MSVKGDQNHSSNMMVAFYSAYRKVIKTNRDLDELILSSMDKELQKSNLDHESN